MLKIYVEILKNNIVSPPMRQTKKPPKQELFSQIYLFCDLREIHFPYLVLWRFCGKDQRSLVAVKDLVSFKAAWTDFILNTKLLGYV